MLKNSVKASVQPRFYSNEHKHGDHHHDHHHHEFKPYHDGTGNELDKYVYGPLPDPKDFAVGIERYEIDKKEKGESLFNIGPDYLTGPHFGTLAEPVLINSYFDERIVGCAGSRDEPHEILWHVVSEARPLVCLECFQVFKLNRLPEIGRASCRERV